MSPTTEEYIEYGKKMYIGLCTVCGKDRWLFESFEHIDCYKAHMTQEDIVRSEWNARRKELTEAVIKRDVEKCCHCFSVDNLTVDHIKPIVAGGTNDLENLQILCQSCNSKKGARTV